VTPKARSFVRIAVDIAGAILFVLLFNAILKYGTETTAATRALRQTQAR
jgi:hypothetical protein